MKKSVVLTLLLLLSIVVVACAAPPPPGPPPTATSPAPKPTATSSTPKPIAAPAKGQADVYALVDGKPNIPDPPKAYPKGELGRMVKLGEDIIYHTHTHPLTKDFVGNDLDCTSCHIDGGKEKTLGTFIGTAAAFPAYSKREKTVQTLQDRINNCFMRSMNGKRPIIDTEASVAMAAYVTWLSQGLPIQMNPAKPINPFYTKLWINKKLVPLAKKATHENYLNGQKLYTQKCAVCHGEDGAEINFADGEETEYVGTVATDNPWEFFNKASVGQPGETMPAGLNLGWSLQDIIDLLTYAQTLKQ